MIAKNMTARNTTAKGMSAGKSCPQGSDSFAASAILPLIRTTGLAVSVGLLAACGGGGAAMAGEAASSARPPRRHRHLRPRHRHRLPRRRPRRNFDTAELRRSDGPEFHGAVSAWQAGINGVGKTIAVIDTGIDVDSPEFAGRLHPNSASVSGTGTVQQEDDHGTNVALVAAAARDDTGVVGIAYNATVLAIRADTPDSCATEDPEDTTLGCTFNDRSIAAGLDLAVRSGARVVNLSLGGSRPSSILAQCGCPRRRSRAGHRRIGGQ